MPLFAMETSLKHANVSKNSLAKAVQDNNAPQVISLIENGVDNFNREELLRNAQSPSQAMLQAISTTISPYEIQRTFPAVVQSIYEFTKPLVEDAHITDILDTINKPFTVDTSLFMPIARARFNQAKQLLHIPDEKIKDAIEKSLNRVLAKNQAIQEALNQALLKLLNEYPARSINPKNRIKRLLSLGADPNAVGIEDADQYTIGVYGPKVKYAYTPLSRAMDHKMTEVIRMLIEAGGNIFFDLNAPLRSLPQPDNPRYKEIIDKPKTLLDRIIAWNPSDREAPLTSVTPQEIQHVIPGAIALSYPCIDDPQKKMLPKDIRKIIISHIIPRIISEKTTFAKKYLWGTRERIGNEIYKSIMRVLKKPTTPDFVTLPLDKLTAPDNSLMDWVTWLLGDSRE